MSTRLDGLDELEVPGVDVTPGVHTTVFVGVGRAERPFAPLGLVIPLELASGFNLLGLRIAGVEVFANACPAAVFATPTLMHVSLPVCAPGRAIELDVVNTTDDVQRFACKFPGRWIDRTVSEQEVRELIARVGAKKGSA